MATLPGAPAGGGTAGWTVQWGPNNAWAYMIAPDGSIMERWFRGDPGRSTFDPFATSEGLGQTVPRVPPPGAVPHEDTYGYGGGAGGLPPEWAWIGPFLEEIIRVSGLGTEFAYGWEEEQRAADLARQEAWRQEEWDRQARLQEEERQRWLAERAVGQEQAWPGLVSRAAGQGLEALGARLPAYLPRTVEESLYGWGERLGSRYAPAWPGATGEGEPQLGPTKEDWIQHILGQGFPGYVLR